MCSGTDSFDISMLLKVLIFANMFDGDAADPSAQSKLNYNKSLAFKNLLKNQSNGI